MRTVNKVVAGLTAVAAVGFGAPEASPERSEDRQIFATENSTAPEQGQIYPFPESIKRSADDCRILFASIGGRAVDLAQVEIDRKLLVGASMIAIHYSSDGDLDDRDVSQRLSLIEDKEISLVTNNTLESPLSNGPKEDHVTTQVSLFRRQADGSRAERLNAFLSVGCVNATGPDRHDDDTESTHTITVPNF